MSQGLELYYSGPFAVSRGLVLHVGVFFSLSCASAVFVLLCCTRELRHASRATGIRGPARELEQKTKDIPVFFEL